MARTLWSGAISFGLVTVPVNVFSGSDHSVRFRQVHLDDLSCVRVREPKDRNVARTNISRGHPRGAEAAVPMLEEGPRAKQLPPAAQVIDIAGFIPLASINPIQIGDGYYLQPSGQVAVKPYKLLCQNLDRSSKVAVAKYAWSGREQLGLLQVQDKVMVLHAMHWTDEIQESSSLASALLALTDSEIAEAAELSDRLTTGAMKRARMRPVFKTTARKPRRTR
ncbi:Ku protein [Streptomyces sp. NPDC055085]